MSDIVNPQEVPPFSSGVRLNRLHEIELGDRIGPDKMRCEVRLSTSLGYPQLTTGIPVGKPMSMSTCGSESPGG